MSRDDGFPIADVDAGYFDDAKLRNLWRALDDPDRMARAVCLHQATLLASWHSGYRVTVAEAVPLWLPVDEELVAELVRVHLLDRSGRLPTRSWNVWFGPAAGRRKAVRERWNRANQRRRAVDSRLPRGHRAETGANPTGPTGPVRPLRPTEPSRPSRAGARETTAVQGNGTERTTKSLRELAPWPEAGR